ncbi:DUF1835 domain-containing protein [Wukongibacter baidiensis]|uniref:DUF1835 domain-containing protein n=1 Tax=Wukongibacter baidiensis TaxID=1723361 RepID=UPI003D7FABB2
MNNYVHIAIGDSANGSLKTLLKSNIQSKYYGSVRKFREDLSIGCIYELENNIDKRAEWFNKIYKATGYSELIQDRYIDKEIELTYTSQLDILRESKIIIWHGENVMEQTALRYLVSRFKENEIYEVSVSKNIMKELKGEIYRPRATAECSLEELRKALKSVSLIDNSRKEILISEWNELRKNEAVLRIYIDNKVICEDETYYDKYILKYTPDEFLKAARVIGSVMGNSGQIVTDAFIDYRIRSLIDSGKLEYRGKLRFMREFDIRLK